jgi:hypothetical protein
MIFSAKLEGQCYQDLLKILCFGHQNINLKLEAKLSQLGQEPSF